MPTPQTLTVETRALGADLLGQSNHKLQHTALVECPELEDARACYLMRGSDLSQTPLCPGCYAAKLGKLRRSRWSARRTTPKHGLIRLGTWKEILEHEYDAFCKGAGVRQDGTPWTRADFPTRFHFVISRGLLRMEAYRRMNANPYLLNLQVSVDIIRVRGGSTVTVPPELRLSDLAALPKVFFRFKTLAEPATYKGVTYEANAAEFTALADRLGLDRMRVLETPLRLGPNRSYGMATPLEAAGWASESFLRCNSPCSSCPSRKGTPGENKVLGCAVTPRILDLLRRTGNEAQPHRTTAPVRGRVAWTDLTLGAWRTLGGEATLTRLYEAVLAREPTIGARWHWKAKVREVVQRHGVRTGPATWRLNTATSSPAEVCA